MHEDVLEVALQWAFVWNSSESGKSFFVYENSKGANTVNKDVDSKIELQTIDEKRFVEVPLDNVAIGFSKARGGSDKKNSSTLATRFWFDDESFSLFLADLLLK